MSYLGLSGLAKSFGHHVAVDGLDLAVEKGELVTLLGGSGCGKTTTLRMIAGFEVPSAGRIEIAGTDVTCLAPHRRGVGMVFQSYALFPNMTAAQNVGYGLRVAGLPRAAQETRVREMLALVHLEDLAGRWPHQLSGGQQQRVALARALAVRPAVLLLDEPLSALDARIRVRLRAEILAIQKELGITTVYVTHDQEEALSISDRVVVMRDGRVEQEGAPAAIYNQPATPFVAAFIGSINILRATVRDPATGTVSLGGHLVSLGGPVSSAPGGELRLSLRPELVSLQGGAAVNRLPGTVSGATLLGSIMRLSVRTDAGDVLVDQLNNPHLSLPAVGSAVILGFEPEACVALAAD